MSPSVIDPLEQFTPSREEALRRLKIFVPKAATDYRRLRNFDFGPENRENVSTLSPYLRNGALSETEVARAVLQRHSPTAAEKFLQEVFWRVYWKGYLDNRPSLWRRYLADLETLRERHQSSDTLSAAEAGETGIECFDFWAKELSRTGYLHNHARMWFASIWIFTLQLPWQLGADFFLKRLLDGDPASNTLGWRWVAGLHTKGKTYLARPDNIVRYTDGRFPAPTRLASEAPALDDAHSDVTPTFAPLPDETELPSQPFGLVVLDDDLRALALDLPGQAAAIGLLARPAYRSLKLSDRVQRFREQCLADGLARSDSSAPLVMTDFAEALQAWASRANLNTIVLLQPQVGPWGDRWPDIESALLQSGLDVRRFRFAWENRLYPHATAGFFKFKKRLPALFQELAP